jgi:hypothetical protein
VLAPSSPVSADSLVAAKREGDSLRDLGDLKSARRVWTRIVEEYRRQGSPAGDAEVAAWAQFEIAQQDASELDRVGLNGTEGEQTREKVAAASTADRSYAKVCVICAGEPCLAAEFEQGQLYERFAADILQRTPSPPANMNEHRCDVDCLMTSVSINSHEHRAKEMRGAARDRYQSALKRCDNARLASSPFCERIRAGLQRLPEESPSLYKSLSESARSRPDGGVPDSAVR